jgi:hypothetical protein
MSASNSGGPAAAFQKPVSREQSLVVTAVAFEPDASDQEIAGRINAALAGMRDAADRTPMTAEVVARWRPEVAW